MTPCPPPIVPSHRKPEPTWVWSPRATGVPPPGNGSGGGVSSLQPSCFLGPPQPGTHGPPPHNQSAFQRKSTPYVSDSFTLQLAMGGQSAGRLASEPPPPPEGSWRARVQRGTSFKAVKQLKPDHLSLMCPLQGPRLYCISS